MKKKLELSNNPYDTSGSYLLLPSLAPSQTQDPWISKMKNSAHFTPYSVRYDQNLEILNDHAKAYTSKVKANSPGSD